MRDEQELSEAELGKISEILELQQEQMLNDVKAIIHQRVSAAKAELESSDLTLSDIEPANEEYFTAVLLSELFSRLHSGDDDVAETILYNLRGQAGLIL
ncbi:hypothetical protein LRP50_09400 [Enterovibrio sp. ZSDZ42]|uniref:Uncharacterized protein n=1 Tax=Enterovibrio gelatinilyticus TaxID=2899819 RepID=A0ABT5QZ91_9GAMM|nr:hypothetical protein [Enterovibrio sp. ZSDZ42]MDD1793340.1 hypothetical protein [Enterovibrio sp. ZSDZ42]